MASVRYRAILFDFDGVLADTERLHAEAFRRVLEAVHQPFSNEEYFGRYIHFDDLNVFLNVSKDRNLGWLPDRLDRLRKKKHEFFSKLMRDPHLLFPGVSELIPRLAARYPMAICSMGRRDEIEPVLNDAGLRRLFTALVTSDDVSKPKPDPEIYLRGLELLNASRGMDIRPDECVVIEDSCGGTRSGKAAGMKVVALTHSLTREELSNAGADVVLDGILSLTSFLMKPVA